MGACPHPARGGHSGVATKLALPWLRARSEICRPRRPGRCGTALSPLRTCLAMGVRPRNWAGTAQLHPGLRWIGPSCGTAGTARYAHNASSGSSLPSSEQGSVLALAGPAHRSRTGGYQLLVVCAAAACRRRRPHFLCCRGLASRPPSC